MEKNDIKSFGKTRERGHEAQEEINTDENVAGTTHLNDQVGEDDEELEKVREDLEKTKEELQHQKDKYLRLFAEFDNFKKRNAKESFELRLTAGRDIVSSLLDTLDDCDRAEKQLQGAELPGSLREGILLVFSKLRSALQNKGLRAMESIHTPFDVEKHEAISEVPVDDKSLKGLVIDEVQKGYYLNDKIIRFAKVVVGK